MNLYYKNLYIGVIINGEYSRQSVKSVILFENAKSLKTSRN